LVLPLGLLWSRQLANSRPVLYNGLMDSPRFENKKYPRVTFGLSLLLVWLAVILISPACQAVIRPEPVIPTASKPVPTTTVTPLPSSTATSTPLPTATFTLAPSETPTRTATVTRTPIPTLTPTWAILRAKVAVRSNCRYGPGWPYLYKYGLVAGTNFEVLGRTEQGSWILVQGVGGNNPCWVRADLMDVQGEVMAVQPTYIPLPLSPYYGPLENVAAVRNEDEVTVSWSEKSHKPGDEMASPKYLLEAWLCQDGQLVFTPEGTNEKQITVIDEPGCAQPSHGRVYFVEKHGYTLWREVPWPEHR
jgi:uncharacterized protein YraI